MEERNNKAKNNFVPEYFLWIEPDEQRKRADELNRMTKRNSRNKKKKN